MYLFSIFYSLFSLPTLPLKNMLLRVIRRTHQRSAFHMTEAQIFRKNFVCFELFRCDKGTSWQMFFGRLQILPNRDDVHIGISNVLNGFKDLVFRFTQTKHNACFGSWLPLFFQVT